MDYMKEIPNGSFVATTQLVTFAENPTIPSVPFQRVDKTWRRNRKFRCHTWCDETYCWSRHKHLLSSYLFFDMIRTAQILGEESLAIVREQLSDSLPMISGNHLEYCLEDQQTGASTSSLHRVPEDASVRLLTQGNEDLEEELFYQDTLSMLLKDNDAVELARAGNMTALLTGQGQIKARLLPIPAGDFFFTHRRTFRFSAWLHCKAPVTTPMQLPAALLALTRAHCQSPWRRICMSNCCPWIRSLRLLQAEALVDTASKSVLPTRDGESVGKCYDL